MAEMVTEDQPRIPFNGKPTKISDIATSSGYPNSSVWCKNIDEVVGVIGRGVVGAITPEHAKLVIDEMVTLGLAEKITRDDEFLGWNIYSQGKSEEQSPQDGK